MRRKIKDVQNLPKDLVQIFAARMELPLPQAKMNPKWPTIKRGAPVFRKPTNLVTVNLNDTLSKHTSQHFHLQQWKTAPAPYSSTIRFE